jgi:hypothetical protein
VRAERAALAGAAGPPAIAPGPQADLPIGAPAAEPEPARLREK